MSIKSIIISKLLGSTAAALILCPATAWAGTITGTVIDPSETRGLQSAQVRIVELDRVVTTERDGSYRFPDVPAGEYTLEVRYVGVDTAVSKVTVDETGIVQNNIVLRSRLNNEILVIGQSANQASALSRKREADGVTSVLTRDAIGQFPDQNVAESLRRLPGVNILNDQGEGRFVSVRGLDPSLNSSSLNGVRIPSPEADNRAVALDVISSDLIESIEVKKSLTPDMDADTIGASIEINTTSAFDRKKSLLSARLEGSYNDYASTVSPKGSVDFSTRLGDNVGIAGGFSYYNREFETDNIEADGWTEDGGVVYAEEVQYRDYDVERERISATLSFDFRVGDSTELYVRGLYSQFDDQEFRRRTIFVVEDAFLAGGSATSALFQDTDPSFVDDPNDPDDEDESEIVIERDIKNRFESQKIRSITAGGKTETGPWKITYSGGWAKSTEDEAGSVDPTSFEAGFNADGVGLLFDYSDERTPFFSFPNGAALATDPSVYGLNDIELTTLSASEDEEYSARFDIAHLFAMDNGDLTVQFGFKGRWRDKMFNKDVEFYEDSTGTYDLSDVLGTQTYRLTDISPIAAKGAAADYFFANRGDFELQEIDSQFDSAVDDYAVQEDIYAGYLLGRWDSDQLRIIGGIRYEKTENEILGNIVTLVEEGGTANGVVLDDDTVFVSPSFIARRYDHWLPSLNIRFEPQRNLVLRAAGYRSVVRPNLDKLAPRFAVEENDGGEREGEFGNPALLPFEAWNFDASVEYYFSSNGAITGNVFYKDIKNFIVDTINDDGGVFNGVAFNEAVIAINGESAEVFGFELGFAQAFTFLPAPLDGLLVNFNYTYTDADGTVPTDGDITNLRTITLPSSSRHTFNAVLGYEKGPINFRLAGTYRDRYLDELGDDATTDRFVDNHFQLDASLKVKVNKNIRLFAEWININNAKYFAYQNFGGARRNLQYEEYGSTVKFGARITM